MTYVPKQVDVNYLSGALLSDCISFWLLIDFLRLISCSPFKSISDTRRLLFLKIPKTCHCHLCTKFTKGVKTETNVFFFFSKWTMPLMLRNYRFSCPLRKQRSQQRLFQWCSFDTLELSILAYQYWLLPSQLVLHLLMFASSWNDMVCHWFVTRGIASLKIASLG